MIPPNTSKDQVIIPQGQKIWGEQNRDRERDRTHIPKEQDDQSVWVGGEQLYTAARMKKNLG